HRVDHRVVIRGGSGEYAPITASLTRAAANDNAMVNTMAAALNATCTSFGFVLVRITLCTSTAAQPATRVSGRVNTIMPNNPPSEPSEYVPRIPGSRTFTVEATRTSRR